MWALHLLIWVWNRSELWLQFLSIKLVVLVLWWVVRISINQCILLLNLWFILFSRLIDIISSWSALGNLDLLTILSSLNCWSSLNYMLLFFYDLIQLIHIGNVLLDIVTIIRILSLICHLGKVLIHDRVIKLLRTWDSGCSIRTVLGCLRGLLVFWGTLS
jgi:hypothetical protein